MSPTPKHARSSEDAPFGPASSTAFSLGAWLGGFHCQEGAAAWWEHGEMQISLL